MTMSVGQLVMQTERQGAVSEEAGPLPVGPSFQAQHQMCLPRLLAAERSLGTPRPWSLTSAGMPSSPGLSVLRETPRDLASIYPEVHHQI